MTDQYGYDTEYLNESQTRSKRWPWIAGIVVAFFLGGGIAMAGVSGVEPEIVTEIETVTEEVEVEVEPADMDDRRQTLDDRETELDERESGLNDREENLDAQASTLEENQEELEEAQAAVDEREEAITEAEEAVAENTISGSGTFIVGEDIEPGTYRTDGTSYCYWERLSGLSGEFHDIITNEFSEGTSYVTIAESDMAFSSQSCGEWVRQ